MAGYKRRPMYYFDDENSTGLDKIPEGSTVVVKNYKGKPKQFVKGSATGLDSTTTIDAAVKAGHIDTSNSDELANRDKTIFTASGYTKRVSKSDRWLETDIPNVIEDKLLDDVYIGGKLVERTDGKVHLPEAPFAPNTTDELLAYHEYSTIDSDSFPDTDTDNDGTAPDSKWTIADGTATVDGNKLTLKNDTDSTVTATVNKAVSENSWYRLKVSETNGTTSGTVKVIAKDTDGNALSTLIDRVVSNSAVNAEFKTPADTTSVDIVLGSGSATTDDTVEFDDYLLESRTENGVSTKVDHSAGDIVHCGNGGELVVNGTFDDVAEGEVGYDNGDGTVEGWTSDNSESLSIENNKLKVDNNGNTWEGGGYTINTIVGCKYIVTADTSSNVTDSALIKRDTKQKGGTNYTIGSAAKLVFTATAEVTVVMFRQPDDDAIGYIDNISVKAIEQTYQAIEPTTSGELLTSSKFQKIDYITRQDVIFIGEDGGYYTTKGIHSFLPGASTDEIASAYGWSKTGNAEYSVSGLNVINSNGDSVVYSGKVTGVSLVSRLNAGAYHPIFNSVGTCNFAYKTVSHDYNDGVNWYAFSSDIEYGKIPVNSYDCFGEYRGYDRGGVIADFNCYRYATDYANGIIQGSIAKGQEGIRPDSKFYDKVYFDGYGGLIFKGSYSSKPNLTDLLESETSKLIGVDDMAESCGVECVETLDRDTNSGTYWIHIPLHSSVYNKVQIGDIITLVKYDGILYIKKNLTVVSAPSSHGAYGDIEVDQIVPRTLGAKGMLIMYNKSLTTQGTSTTIDIIG